MYMTTELLHFLQLKRHLPGFFKFNVGAAFYSVQLVETLRGNCALAELVALVGNYIRFKKKCIFKCLVLQLYFYDLFCFVNHSVT